MKHLFMILVCAWFGMMNTVAQEVYRVSGKVETLNGETLPGANVKLTNVKQGGKMSGASTDADGTFSIPVAKGTYQLEISFVGYVTYVSGVEVKEDVRLPVITLGEDAQLMDEVVVTARTVTYHSNGYIAEISKNPFYKNQDMSAILRMTPGTRVTMQGLEAYGNSISKVYLNGRELRLRGQELLDYLQTIEGKNVKRMEVVAATGVEEDAATSGAAILKITTINPETGGLLGIGGLGFYREHSQTYGGNMNLQWRINKKWGVYGRFSKNKSNFESGNRSETHFYATDERRISEDESRRKSDPINTSLGVTFDLDENNLFSIEGTYNSLPNNERLWDETRSRKGQTYENVARGSSLSDGKVDFLDLSFLYLHRFGKNGELTFHAEAYKREDEDRQERVYDYASGEKQESKFMGEEANTLYTLKADYTHNFPSVKGKLEAGLKAQWLENDNRNNYLALVNGQKDEYGSYIDHYIYKDKVYAAYAKYSFDWKNFKLNAGVRMEHNIVMPYSATNPERNVESDYTDFFPEVGVSYFINKEKGHNTSLSYQKGVQRPLMGMLNPVVLRQGEYNYYMGNPLLKPYATHHFSWTTHLAHQYIFRVAYQQSDGGFLQLGENKDGVIYSTTYNQGKSSSLSAYASVPVRLGKNVRLTFNGNFSRNYTSHGEYERTYNRWYAGCSGMFMLPAGFQLMADFTYFPKMKNMYGEEDVHPMANLRLSKTFLKGKLNTTLMMGDIFNYTSHRRSESYYDTYSQVSEGTKRSLGITLNIRYNIRWGQKSNVRQAGSSSGEGRF